MSAIIPDAGQKQSIAENHAPGAARIHVGIDVGGTFTDFVVVDGNGLRVHKLSTTPDDQSRAIVAGLRALGVAQAEIVHGMTVATNALLERRGARTALLTTAGFGDVLVIGRQNRPELYSLSQGRSRPLVEDALRLEVVERVDAGGAVLAPLDEAALDGLADALEHARAESLAVCFLFSFRNPAHERAAAARIAARLPDLPISLSSEILPEYREYERTATTVINAYVQPLVARYLARLEAALAVQRAPARVRIMQSNGGAIGLGEAARRPARLVLSGPAGGVVGAFAVAQQAHALETGGGEGGVNLLTIDMGGTSTDVALCPGAIPTTAESTITDLPLRLPAIDIHTVGAGGGSVAFVDAGGGLRVGPRSAGALPGPACYGRGGAEATVTDANVVLGRLDPAGFLDGRGDVALDVASARRVLAELGARFSLSAEHAALGVIRVANATMERALRRVSIERGHDPRRFTLLPFGGAGPLHACDLAAALGIRRVLVPRFPGVLSAYGMLASGVSTDASQSLLRRADDLGAAPGALAQAVAALEEQVRAVLEHDGVAAARLGAALDARYVGQSYELTVPLALPATGAAVAAAAEAFHAAHAQRYGYALEGEAVEIVTVRVRGDGPGLALGGRPAPLHDPDASAARTGVKPVWFDSDAPQFTAIYDRTHLLPGHRLAGPALIFQFDATTVVAPGWAVRVDALGNLHLENTR